MQFQARNRARLIGLTLSLFAAMGGGQAEAAGTPSQFTVTGAVTTPGTYDYASLSALTPLTQVDTFQSGKGGQTHDYQGASLWGILSGAGIVTNPARHNDLLNRYVLATASDGYKVVYSLGELSPSYGNQAALVAYAEDTGAGYAPLGADGFARTTAPWDIKGGRYASNLVNLDVRASASTVAGTGGGVSASFSVSGDVNHAMSFNLAALKGMASTTTTAFGHSYTGVSFWDLLNGAVGIATDAAVKNDLLGMYVVVTATDGYQSVFSMGELSGDFGNQPDLIAFQMDGEDLTTSGFARLVAANDASKGRWVSNISGIEVFHAAAPVPEPAVYAQMLLGLALVGGLGWRRYRG